MVRQVETYLLFLYKTFQKPIDKCLGKVYIIISKRKTNIEGGTEK